MILLLQCIYILFSHLVGIPYIRRNNRGVSRQDEIWT